MLLLACPKCARQYDVTHLAPRSHVRCVCDERFEVSWRRPFSVAPLECGRCAAPIESTDQECGHCGAALSERDRRLAALCPSCFSRIESDSRHCRACGVGIQPQALPPIPDGRSCPRCSGGLRIRMLEQGSVIECEDCEGLWIENRTFLRICKEARASAAPRSEPRLASPAPASSEEAMRYIPCLSCGELMFRRQFTDGGRPSRVVVDRCRDHGTWLDRDELERVLSFLARSMETHASAAGLDPMLADEFRRTLPPRSPRPGAPRSRLSAALAFVGGLLFDDIFA